MYKNYLTFLGYFPFNSLGVLKKIGSSLVVFLILCPLIFLPHFNCFPIISFFLIIALSMNWSSNLWGLLNSKTEFWYPNLQDFSSKRRFSQLLQLLKYLNNYFNCHVCLSNCVSVYLCPNWQSCHKISLIKVSW